jgi:hypothetical protein
MKTQHLYSTYKDHVGTQKHRTTISVSFHMLTTVIIYEGCVRFRNVNDPTERSRALSRYFIHNVRLGAMVDLKVD